jgi:hypothetical protein
VPEIVLVELRRDPCTTGCQKEAHLLDEIFWGWTCNENDPTERPTYRHRLPPTERFSRVVRGAAQDSSAIVFPPCVSAFWGGHNRVQVMLCDGRGYRAEFGPAVAGAEFGEPGGDAVETPERELYIGDQYVPQEWEAGIAATFAEVYAACPRVTLI